MIIERVESLSELDALEPEWRALEPRLPRLPFFSYDWMRSWWNQLHADRAGVRDELFIRAFRTSSGELRGVVPMMRTSRPGYGPLRVRQIQLFGADPNITEVRGFATPPEHTAEVLSALLEHLQASNSEWDFMQLTGVPAEHADRVSLVDFGNARWMRDVPNYYLNLAPTWEEFKGKLSRNIKESLRKCYNAPKRDGVSLDLTVVREVPAVRAAVLEFLRLHDARSKLEDTVQHVNVFGAQAAKDFLVEVCERFAARDKLRIFQLKIKDAVVATRIGFCCEESLYLYYSGYDPEYARYSIMTTTVAEAIQFAIREGFQTVNLSTGNDVSKLRWSPEEAVYREALLVSPSLRGTITHESYSWVRRNLEGALSQARLATFLSRRG